MRNKQRSTPIDHLAYTFYLYSMPPTICANCETPVHSEQKFCPSCGQKAAVGRINIHYIWHEAVHYFTHADKGIFHLIKELLTRPGKVSRDYVLGKRKKYFPPVNFFLLVAAVYVFAVNTFSKDVATQSISAQQQSILQRIPDPVKKKEVESIYKRAIGASQFMRKYSNIVAMFATPFITIIFWLLYYRGPFNYTEHLVANLYISGITALSFALIFNPLISLFKLPQLNPILYTYFVLEVAYRSVSYYNFMNKRTPAGLTKAILVSLAGVLVWVLFSFYLIMAYIRTGFWLD